MYKSCLWIAEHGESGEMELHQLPDTGQGVKLHLSRGLGSSRSVIVVICDLDSVDVSPSNLRIEHFLSFKMPSAGKLPVTVIVAKR